LSLLVFFTVIVGIVVEKVVENMDDDIKNLIMEILEDAC